MTAILAFIAGGIVGVCALFAFAACKVGGDADAREMKFERDER